MKVILQDEDNELLYDLIANFVAGLSIVKNVSGIYACSYEFNKKIHVDLRVVFDYGFIETQEKINVVSAALKRDVKYLEKKTGIILTICSVNILFVEEPGIMASYQSKKYTFKSGFIFNYIFNIILTIY